MEENKKIVKLAVLRSDDDSPCPFGLPINYGCSNAGEIIKNMAPLSIIENASKEELDAISEANLKLLLWNNPQARCIYSEKLMKGVVNCLWEDSDDNIKGVPSASTYFQKMFSGIGLDGLYSIPMGYLSDGVNPTHQMFSGSFNLESAASEDIENED